VAHEIPRFFLKCRVRPICALFFWANLGFGGWKSGFHPDFPMKSQLGDSGAVAAGAA
jgi:hypothetical protein